MSEPKNPNPIRNSALILADEIRSVFKNSYVSIPPDISNGKCVNAINTYARGVTPADVLMLVDLTLWGNAKNGLLLTESMLFASSKKGGPKSIPLSDVRTIAFDKSESQLTVNGDLFCEGGLLFKKWEPLCDFLRQIILETESMVPPTEAPAPAPEPLPAAVVAPVVAEIKCDVKVDQLFSRIEAIKREIVTKIEVLRSESTPSNINAATSPWCDIDVESLKANPPTALGLPAEVRVGEFFNERLRNTAYSPLSFPVKLPLAKRKGFFFRSSESSAAHSEDLIQSTVLRILCSLPAGLVQIHFIDLQTQGLAFGALDHLDPRIAPAAPTTPEDVIQLLSGIEFRVADVRQRCLSDHGCICEFNQAHPDAPEKYHIICISGFPIAFDDRALNSASDLLQISGLPIATEETALKPLSNLLQNDCAARAGISFFISSPENLPADAEFSDLPFIFYGDDKVDLIDGEMDTSKSTALAALMLVPDGFPENANAIIDWLNSSLKT